jgi:hypothetical protein
MPSSSSFGWWWWWWWWHVPATARFRPQITCSCRNRPDRNNATHLGSDGAGASTQPCGNAECNRCSVASGCGGGWVSSPDDDDDDDDDFRRGIVRTKCTKLSMPLPNAMPKAAWDPPPPPRCCPHPPDHRPTPRRSCLRRRRRRRRSVDPSHWGTGRDRRRSGTM